MLFRSVAGVLTELSEHPMGKEILAAAARGDMAGARSGLMNLAQCTDLSPACIHHLALFFHRAAVYAEEQAEGKTADPYWRLAWSCWLRVLETGGGVGRPAQSAEGAEEMPKQAPPENYLLTRLLGMHRRYIHDYLARNAVEDARRHWGYVDGLLAQAEVLAVPVATGLAHAVARFREELATEYLTATREVLKHGAAGPGWRADYENGLRHLRRLLSLDRENLRLLTALVDICGDWFLDCYNNEDPATLCEQLGRYTPFALKLARLVEQRSQELAARAALAEFYKFRGLTASDRDEKLAIYREAARFNPDNDNVQELLREVEKGTRRRDDHE